MLLCTVLLLCLLAMVYAITRHFYSEASQELVAQARAVAESVELRLEENPNIPLEALEGETIRLQQGFDEVQLIEEPGQSEIQSVVLEQGEDGTLRRVSRVTIEYGDRRLLLVAGVAVTPQTEVLRVFRNRNLALLITVFIVVLGLMVYFISRTLQPLRELSRSCSDIIAGKLRNVEIHTTSSEIMSLEKTFNDMVASLKEKEMVESKLRQAQRLSAIGTLAAGVAHDVRNPLNAIKLLSSHAMDTLGEDTKSFSAKKQLQTIRTEVDRLEDIVSSFLSLAKETELNPEPHGVDELLRECVALLQKDAETREVQLNVELRCGDTQFMLDRRQWNRAVLNVLINALEACPPGGRVRVFSRLTLTHCEVEIRDDGPGMSADEIEHAFDPYYTTKDMGTGLGLSITRGIVEEHGGSISLTSVEGQGCQALIQIPLEDQVK